MKKIIMVCLAILPISFVIAQKPYYGIKAGVNSSNIVLNSGKNYDYKIGFNAGLLLHVHASKTIALQPELNYSEQGGKNNVSGVTDVVKLKYIQIPILVQYMFGPGYRFQAGPQFSYLAGASHEFGQIKNDVKSSFKNTDVSLSLGAGLLTHSQIGIDVRYNIGLTNISNATAPTQRNNVGQLTVFYMFNHRGK